jgi:hypothetical protein
MLYYRFDATFAFCCSAAKAQANWPAEKKFKADTPSVAMKHFSALTL